MTREILAPLLALVVLVNVAAIAFALSGRPWPLRPGRPTLARFARRADPRVGAGVRFRLTDRPVPTAAAWERVLTAESARHAGLQRPATVVALELVGLDRLAEREGAARAALLRWLVLNRLREATQASDPVGWDGAGTFGIVLLGADAPAAAAYVAHLVEWLRPWVGGVAAPVQLAIGWVSPPVGADLHVALGHAQLRMAAHRSRFPLRTIAA